MFCQIRTTLFFTFYLVIFHYQIFLIILVFSNIPTHSKQLIDSCLSYLTTSPSFKQVLVFLENQATQINIELLERKKFAGLYDWQRQIIYVNPNSEKPLEAILAEEIFHAYQHSFYVQKQGFYYFTYLRKTTALELEVRLWRSYVAKAENLSQVIAPFEQKYPNPIEAFERYFQENTLEKSIFQTPDFLQLYQIQHLNLKKITIYRSLFLPRHLRDIVAFLAVV